MNYIPDPGGIFVSDVHRRTAGHLPLPDEPGISVASLFARLVPDIHAPFANEFELTEVLESLAADDLAVREDELWRQSGEGTAALIGPVADEPPPLEGAALKAAEKADEELRSTEEEIVAQAKAERVERLKAELEEAEADA